MKAIYKGTLYSIVGDNTEGLQLMIDENDWLYVDYNDPDLIIDPTDDEVDNLEPEDVT